MIPMAATPWEGFFLFVCWRTEKPVGKVIMDRLCERKGHGDKNRVDRGRQAGPGVNLK